MKIIASNFKTNHTRKSTAEYVKDVNKFLKDNSYANEVLVFPSNTALDKFSTVKNLHIGTQNAYHIDEGSFTGEIGSVQLDEFNIKTILLGHSERRLYLGENQKEIIEKFKYYKKLNYKIVYCIGEPIEIRNLGTEQTMKFLLEQLDGIDLSYENLIIAYEPVWAIGTGSSARVDEIEAIHTQIKQTVNKPLLYGGSVKKTNVEEILLIPNVDGVLIGTASWNVEDFKEIIKISEELK